MRHIKKFLATALAVVMTLSISVPAFAAEPALDVAEQEVAVAAVAADGDKDDYGVMPLLTTNYYWIGSPGEQYTQIAYSRYGLNCLLAVNIEDFNSVLYQVDIEMVGNNGLIWREDNCMKMDSGRTFECGLDVTTVYLRIKPRAALITGDRAFRVRVEY